MDWKKNCRKRRFFFPLDRAVTYVRIGTCFQRLGAPKLTGSRSFRAVIAKQFAHQYFVMSVVVNTEQGQWNAVGQNGNVVSQQRGERGRVPNPPPHMQANYIVNRAPGSNDPYVQNLSRKILKLTLIMGVIAIVRNITLLYMQFYEISMVEMLLPLMIPYCGYEGARRRNRALVNCFWGCSAFILTLYILQLLFSVNYFIQAGKNPDHQHTINVEGHIAMLITGGVAAVFQTAACIWGRQLAHTEYMLYVSHAHVNRGQMVGGRRTAHVNADGTIIYVTNMGPVSAVSRPVQEGVDSSRLASFHTATLDDAAMAADDWDKKGKNSSCVICLDDFETGATVKQLPGCGHMFHSHCIDQWLSGHTRCPNCNNDVSGSQQQA